MNLPEGMLILKINVTICIAVLKLFCSENYIAILDYCNAININTGAMILMHDHDSNKKLKSLQYCSYTIYVAAIE